jgi:hypothetical protein
MDEIDEKDKWIADTLLHWFGKVGGTVMLCLMSVACFFAVGIYGFFVLPFAWTKSVSLPLIAYAWRKGVA